MRLFGLGDHDAAIDPLVDPRHNDAPAHDLVAAGTLLSSAFYIGLVPQKSRAGKHRTSLLRAPCVECQGTALRNTYLGLKHPR